MKIYAAMIWHEWDGEYRPRIYTKVGSAKSFCTRNNKPKHGIQFHEPYVVEGDTDDMVRIEFDHQARAEHFESRMIARAEENMQLAAGPIAKPKRKRKVA